MNFTNNVNRSFVFEMEFDFPQNLQSLCAFCRQTLEYACTEQHITNVTDVSIQFITEEILDSMLRHRFDSMKQQIRLPVKSCIGR